MKGNLLLLKDSLEPKKAKFINTWLQFKKNVYIDKLDDIVDKYNNTYYSTIKMKPVDVKSSTYVGSSKKINDTNPKFKLLILLEYQNIKMLLQKVTLQIGLMKFLWLKKLIILCHGHMLLIIFMEKKLFKCFTKTNCKRQIKSNLELKK